MLSHLRPPVPSSPVSLSSPLASPLPPSLSSLPLPSLTLLTLPQKQQCIQKFHEHKDAVLHLSQSKLYVFSSSFDRTIISWDKHVCSPSPPLPLPSPPLPSSWSIFYNFEFLEFLISNSSNSRFSKPSILQLYTYHDYKHRHRSIILQIQGIRGKL